VALKTRNLSAVGSNAHAGGAVATALAAWYKEEKHRYVFRLGRTPYRTWITEIFLQQTQISAAQTKLAEFLTRFPDVASLAHGPESAVLAAFRGMGYYSRARNMFRAANEILKKHGGAMPVAYTALVQIPGIGHYTAAIIASIHNNEKVLALDANHARVLARLAAIDAVPGTTAFKRAAEKAAEIFFESPMPPGDVNEALMQWGQTICKKTPHCAACFARAHCTAFLKKSVAAYPRPKKRANIINVLWVLCIARKRDRYQIFKTMPDFPFLRGELLFPGYVDAISHKVQATVPQSIPPKRREQLEKMAHTQPIAFRHAITRHRIRVKFVETTPIAGGEFFTMRELRERCHSSFMQKALARLGTIEGLTNAS